MKTLELIEQKESLTDEQLTRKSQLLELKSKIESADNDSSNIDIEDEF